MKRLVALLMVLLAGTAEAQVSGSGVSYFGVLPNAAYPSAAIYPAKAYGSCTWDSTHDVGPCVNSAIAAAAAAGGGTVMLPCTTGTYGLSTQILNQNPGVHIMGCGTGSTRQTTVNSHIFAATRLQWIGSPTAAPALLVETAAGASISMYSADVWGVAVDCADICDKAIMIRGVSQSFFNIGGAGSRVTNIEFTTPVDMASPGNQNNDVWAVSRDTSSTYSPTGIFLDGGCFGCTNTSYNRFHILNAWYNKGDGIVFGNSDNILVDDIRDFPNPGATGSPVVIASRSYVSPNGISPTDYGRGIRILHDGSHGIHVTGFQTGSTFTAAGGNVGSAAVAPLVIATNASSAQSSAVLNFASTTGVTAGESVSCGGPVNGVFNGTPTASVTSTTVTLFAQFTTTVPSTTNCTFTYGFTEGAVAGTYTLLATSGTQYTLTAPAGGHTQAGITASGGFLTFTDILIPWTGTPTTNDSWTIVAPIPPIQVQIENVDKGNNLPIPTFEAGNQGYWLNDNQLYPYGWNMACVVGVSGVGGGRIINSSATGLSACVIGGEGNSATGEAAVAMGGSGLSASGFAATAIGQNNTASGADGFVGGNSAIDRGHQATNCWGVSKFSVNGDAQTCYTVLRGTGATASAIRLTTNAGAASTINCINIPNNTAFTLNMDIVAFDRTTVTKNASWNNLTGLLTRGANAASTALAITSATPAVTYSNGTLTGNAMSITADTTQGCLNISWTPPTGNTDTWDAVVTVTTTEVQ